MRLHRPTGELRVLIDRRIRIIMTLWLAVHVGLAVDLPRGLLGER